MLIYSTLGTFLPQYPKYLLDLEYEPSSSVRGLHYDIGKGLLLKMDQFHNIQLGSVYRGRRRISDREVKRLYRGSLRVPLERIEANEMVQLVDVFSKPAMCLLSSVVQWFVDNRVRFLPESIFHDVRVRMCCYCSC